MPSWLVRAKIIAILMLVVFSIVGFWWPPGFAAVGVLILWFLGDDQLARQVKNENQRVFFSSGLSKGDNRLDEHQEFIDHDRP